MNIKENLLDFLDRTDDFCSGEHLAKELNVSRSAVWKAVNELCDEGFLIDKSKKGYRLSDKNKVVFYSQLARFLEGFDTYLYDELPSTNLTAKALAEKGAKEKTVCIARTQTCGRGRLARRFFSPVGGLYFSVVLRPCIAPEYTVLITTAAAVAAARTIEKFSPKKAEIKWVNDIFIDSKKVCGILTEGSFGAETLALDYAVLGVGFNLCGSDALLPDEIKNTAAFIFNDGFSSLLYCRFIACFLEQFFNIYKEIETKNFLPEYNSRSFLLGKRVTFLKDGVLHSGIAGETDNNAHLLINEDGVTVSISSGEVSVKCED